MQISCVQGCQASFPNLASKSHFQTRSTPFGRSMEDKISLELPEDGRELACLFSSIVKEVIQEKIVQDKYICSNCTAEAEDQVELLGHKTCTSWNNDFRSNLLRNDEDIDTARNIFVNSAYPEYPLYESLALRIFTWIKTNCCPFLAKQSLSLLNDESSQERRRKLCDDCERPLLQIRPILKEIGDSQRINEINSISDSELVVMNYGEDTPVVPVMEVKVHVSELLEILQERGIMYVLGIRETVGSIIKTPPASSELMKSFMMLQNEKSKLTVGARALSKHFHRCRNEWWGDCKGSEMQKNEHAIEVLQKIVNDCVWINIHLLPHSYEVIEIRCKDGYGARWTSDGSKFRGFLEPQMEDGHAVGWRH